MISQNVLKGVSRGVGTEGAVIEIMSNVLDGVYGIAVPIN